MRLKSKKTADYVIIFFTLALVVFGLVMLASASSNLAKNQFNDSFYFLKRQALYGVSLGLIGFFMGATIYYGVYQKLAFAFLLIAVLALLLIFTPLGLRAGGAQRWLQIGRFSFQPSEVVKLFFILYLAAWLSSNADRQKSFWRGFVPLMIVLGTILFLLLKQPATSTSLILMAVAMVMYFASGARLSYILSVIIAGLLTVSLLIYVTPYRLERVKTFFRPDANLQTTGYHVNQTKNAIGFGGLWGVGYGQSTTKIKYLPEPIGDSIFAVIAEELGFLGGMTLIGVLFILVLRLLIIAARARDHFAQLLLVGFATLIALQSFINIGAISGLLPLTGTPLPFISYGSSALVVFMTMMGIATNVSKYN